MTCPDGPAAAVAAGTARQRVGVPPGVRYQDLPAPSPQPNMPDAATAAALPAAGMPAIDVASIPVPDAP